MNETSQQKDVPTKEQILNQIIACPVCQNDLTVPDSASSLTCSSCLASFNKESIVWNFIPNNIPLNSPIWQTWHHVQENGLAAYVADPCSNLSINASSASTKFASFCAYRGLVLDVGCGPQPWPAYFDNSRDATYVGIDPLIGEAPGEFLKIKALAESPPFRAHIFDHVLFSTTLDHFADPATALKAAIRVCKLDGEIDVWLGEKSSNAPKPAVSPEWYTNLTKPELSEDLFHIERLDSHKFLNLIEQVGLTIIESEVHQVDDFRLNRFYRLKTI